MMKTGNKWIAILMALILIVGLLPVSSLAADGKRMVTINADPSQVGRVSFNGEIWGGSINRFLEPGEDVTVYARLAPDSAESGYVFDGWYEGELKKSDESVYTFQMPEDDYVLQAKFVNSYTVTVTADPTEGGTVSGGGSVEPGKSVTVKAEANEEAGYEFMGWYEEEEWLTGHEEYTIDPVTRNMDLTAKFSKLCKVTLDMNGGQIYDFEGEMWQNAVSMEMYTGDGQEIPTLEWMIDAIESGSWIKAPVGGEYIYIGAEITDEDGTRTYPPGDYYEIVSNATVKVLWQLSAVVLEPDRYNFGTEPEGYDAIAPETVTLKNNTGLEITLGSLSGAPDYDAVALDKDAQPISSSYSILPGESINIAVNPKSGLTEGIYDETLTIAYNDGADKTLTVQLSFTVTGPVTPTQYTISVTADPDEGGSVSGGGTYNAGESVTVKAVANAEAGYEFMGWYAGKTYIDYREEYTITSVTGDMNLTAKFVKLCTVTLDMNGGQIYDRATEMWKNTVSMDMYTGYGQEIPTLEWMIGAIEDGSWIKAPANSEYIGVEIRDENGTNNYDPGAWYEVVSNAIIKILWQSTTPDPTEPTTTPDPTEPTTTPDPTEPTTTLDPTELTTTPDPTEPTTTPDPTEPTTTPAPTEPTTTLDPTELTTTPDPTEPTTTPAPTEPTTTPDPTDPTTTPDPTDPTTTPDPTDPTTTPDPTDPTTTPDPTDPTTTPDPTDPTTTPDPIDPTTTPDPTDPTTPSSAPVSAIKIGSEGGKKEYTQGEELDLKDLELEVTHSDGSKKNIPVTPDMISGFDKDKVGKQTLTVNYEGCTDTFEVVVKAKETTAAGTSIISYNLNGGTLNGKTGTVTIQAENGSTIILPAPTREGYTFDYWEGSKYKAGDSYTVNGDHTLTAQWKKVGTVTPGTADPGNIAPEMGDESSIALWIAMILASLAAVGLMLPGTRKRKTQE